MVKFLSLNMKKKQEFIQKLTMKSD